MSNELAGFVLSDTCALCTCAFLQAFGSKKLTGVQWSSSFSCCVIYIFTCIAKWGKNYELQEQTGMLYSAMHILTDGGVKEMFKVQGWFKNRTVKRLKQKIALEFQKLISEELLSFTYSITFTQESYNPRKICLLQIIWRATTWQNDSQ